jgi:hypothetical protein
MARAHKVFAADSEVKQPVIPIQSQPPIPIEAGHPVGRAGRVTGSHQPDGKVLPERRRGTPCQRRDCRCVRSEKPFASSILPVQ